MTVHGNEVWSGLFVELSEDLDLANNDQLVVKVWAPITGEFNLKIENLDNNQNFYEQSIPVETANEWVEVVIDLTEATADNPGPFGRIVLFPGFNTTTDETYYFDDIELRSSDGE
jgi:hypothetical protein